MSQTNQYRDLDGNHYTLSQLDAEERKLIDRLLDQAKVESDWNNFGNYWTAQVANFYKARGLDRKQIIKTVGYCIGQDLESRLGIASGNVRQSDYRDELETIILTRYKNRRAFCESTGLSEDMLSHVLAKRKNLAIDTLAEALGKIGYAIHILPQPEVDIR
jgi:hypothetical protein